jgi:hypothetical protein
MSATTSAYKDGVVSILRNIIDLRAYFRLCLEGDQFWEISQLTTKELSSESVYQHSLVE